MWLLVGPPKAGVGAEDRVEFSVVSVELLRLPIFLMTSLNRSCQRWCLPTKTRYGSFLPV